jgi:hypothetical protein
MHDNTSQERDAAYAAWGPLDGLDPVQEYRQLADELREAFPDATAQQLDRMIAQEMARYGGHSVAVITQAMLAASLHLADSQVDEAPAYVERTVALALQQEPDDAPALGWGM